VVPLQAVTLIRLVIRVKAVAVLARVLVKAVMRPVPEVAWAALLGLVQVPLTVRPVHNPVAAAVVRTIAVVVCLDMPAVDQVHTYARHTALGKRVRHLPEILSA